VSRVAQSVWLRTTSPGFSLRQRHRIFHLTSGSRPALGPTQLPVHWVPAVRSLGVKRDPGVMLTTHPLKEEWELYLLSPQAPPWRVARPLCLCLTILSSYCIRKCHMIMGSILSSYGAADGSSRSFRRQNTTTVDV
jgi:hypothetical protein